MPYAELKAIVASNEFNLDKIAIHFGINMKYKWEDTLLLGPDELKGIIREPAAKEVRIFHFGSVVFNHFRCGQLSARHR